MTMTLTDAFLLRSSHLFEVVSVNYKGIDDRRLM